MTSTAVKVIWADFGSISTRLTRNLLIFNPCAQDETRTHTILRPLPPQSSVYTNFTTCASRHVSIAALKRTLCVPRTGLEPAHLAACAPETHASTNSAIWAKKKSGKRDSNSRPRPWQGRALPTELFPHSFKSLYQVKDRYFSKAGAKVLLFFELTKFLSKKMQKKCIFLRFYLNIWDFYSNFAAKNVKL